MSENDESPPKKKYKLWERNESIPVPVRTRERWGKNINENIDVNDELVAAALSDPPVEDGEMVNVSCNSETFNDEEVVNNEADEEVCVRSVSSENENSISEIAISEEDSTIYTNVSADNEADQSITSDSSENQCGLDNYSNDDTEESDNDNDLVESIEGDIVLFEGSQSTTDKCVLRIMELYIKHKMTKHNLSDMLKMMNGMLPQPNNMPKTVYKLFSYVEELAQPCAVTRHYYCRNCLLYNGPMDNGMNDCAACSKNCGRSFFFEFDLLTQISNMFEYRNLANILKTYDNSRDPNLIEDITDGTEYIRVNSRQGRGKYDLTLMLNTDGISLSKSSKSHCWPLMFMIAEVPEHLRESFLVITGLWYDQQKPSMNTFLQPFCLKIQQCFHEGVKWNNPNTNETCSSVITAPVIIADAPARAQIQNILQFNGKYGCNVCEIETKPCTVVEGQKTVNIYPFIDPDDITLRTGDTIENQGKEAIDRNMIIKGVKGPTIISCIPGIDVGTCLLPEYMHAVLYGPGKQFLKTWVEKPGDWSIKPFLNEIDSFICNILPPNTFGRMPRGIAHASIYKASEYYNWILYYSLPALVNYLPEKYFQHWLLFVIAIFKLLKRNIHVKNDVEDAERLLALFVKGVESLYGDRQLTYNVHQLLHLGLCVRRWGPLWATSAFPFENYNGVLANFVHGSKHIGQEIVNNMSLLEGTHILKYKVDAFKITASKEKVYDTVIGKEIQITFNDMECELSRELNKSNGFVYARAAINNEIYNSGSYKKNKTNSYTVQIEYRNGTSKIRNYGSIKFFVRLEDDFAVALKPFKVIHTKMFYHQERRKQVEHIVPISEEDNRLILIRRKHISHISKVIRVGEYICKPPNLFHKNM